MLNITVYGPGCSRCKETEKLVRRVVEACGIDARVGKVSDFAEMAKAGILTTPAVEVDGVVKVTGRIPDEDEIRNWLLPA